MAEMGSDLYKKGEPVKGNIDPYIKHTYDWAFIAVKSCLAAIQNK